MAGVKTMRISDGRTSSMALHRGLVRHLAGPDDGIHTVDVHVNELRPGGGLGHYHYHERADNIYLVLEGTMQAVIEGRHFALPPDSCLVIPAGMKHAAGNAGDGTARLIEIYAPAGKDFHIVDDPERVLDGTTGKEMPNPFLARPRNSGSRGF